ncbi:helix-turn-helix domain-containing protein [Methylomonas rapida]|uniref:Helix-turn-helix domain-containing protein n=1 Tax=Methylomonas rapida TaxID=2963939 RepID=A0ABY7GKD0_9GAMM|nr:helix-turn-helix domain-containing protein [Methylomonas rapida]WAR44952.1 helix-turn-helix domain-containing protein [Methylomonas rapida]
MYTTQTGTQPLQPSNHTKTAFFVISTLLVGTGTAYSMDRTEEWRHHIQPRVAFVVDKVPESTDLPATPDVRTAVEHIDNIRSVLNPSVADLANLFDISRQAIYKWLSGDSIPEPEKLDRIVKLSQIADDFNAEKISRAGSLLKMKTFNGRSLMDLLKAGEDCTMQVTALIKEAKAMEVSYQRSGLANSKAKLTSDWQSYLSIPGSSEQDSQG